MTITADDREPDNPFDEETLSCGDYVIDGINGGFIVERKEWTDFVSSYRSGNLFTQLSMCMEQDYEVLLLLEGKRSEAKKYANASFSETRRVYSSIVAKFPIGVCHTRNYDETIQFIQDLDRWVNDDSNKRHNVRETEKVSAGDRPRYIAEGLPGVGAEMAVRLVSHFGSARALFAAGAEDLQEVDGIGPKTAEKITDAITREYEE